VHNVPIRYIKLIPVRESLDSDISSAEDGKNANLFYSAGFLVLSVSQTIPLTLLVVTFHQRNFSSKYEILV
jgi:hypothetical protein